MQGTKWNMVVVGCVVAGFAWGKGGWPSFDSVRMTVKEKGEIRSDKTYIFVRRGNDTRVEGTFAINASFAKVPHVELANTTGQFLFVPEFGSALKLLWPIDQDRLNLAVPIPACRIVFDGPKELLQEGFPGPVRLDGKEKIAGRDCYVVTTADGPNSAYQEKLWIDETYGILLKKQNLEQGKATFERVVTEISFNSKSDTVGFELPVGTKVVNGIVSPGSFEKLGALGEIGMAAELATYVSKERNSATMAGWVSVISAPAGLKYATTSYRPPVRIWRTTVVTVPNAATQNSRNNNDNNNGSDRTSRRQRIREQQLARIQTMNPTSARINNRPQTATKTEAVFTEGMFVSEFIDPETGKTLAFYQSGDTDPTQSIAPKSMLGAGEDILVNGTKGKVYSTKEPFQFVTVVWKSGSAWYGLAASGLSAEQLVPIANGVKRLQ